MKRLVLCLGAFSCLSWGSCAAEAPPLLAAAGAENTAILCADEVDNDGDGAVDCGDADCQALPGACDGQDTSVDGGAGTDSETPSDTTVGETWTIMAYEDADNNLEQDLLNDVNEMELATLPENVNLIVLLDRTGGYSNADGDWKGAKLFRITHDEDPAVINSERLADDEFLMLTDDSADGEELDMGSGETLAKFIDYCQKAFPADHYILHFSDHGAGWEKKGPAGEAQPLPLLKGVCSDDSSGNILSISEDVPAAMEGKGIEAVTYDACIMGDVEVAWAMKDVADYMGVSVMSIPSAGFQYTTFLNAWAADMSAKTWVTAAVEAFEDAYAGQNDVGFTAVDLTVYDELGAKLDAFIGDALAVPTEQLLQAKKTAARPDPLLNGQMVDFVSIINAFAAVVPGDKSTVLLDTFDAGLMGYWYSANKPRIKGLSIYAPKESWFGGGWDDKYDATPFAIDTRWDELVKPLTEE